MDKPLRRGWTTGACAAAAAKAAWAALLTGRFPDPVAIRLPRGETPEFPLNSREQGAGWARASVIKDAGDDPDVTHGAEMVVTIEPGPPGGGLSFWAGEGVGRVTLPGLPLPVGEPAINPGPRLQIADNMRDVSEPLNAPLDAVVTIAIPGGQLLAARTMNARLGIVGGLSVLGTTGVVIPYSCAAWVHAIQRGVDVARACGFLHLAGCTGKTSEAAVLRLHGLEDRAMVDMGGFAGALLKYVRARPVPRLTIGGGLGKLAKLAAGEMDLHSSAASVDLPFLVGVLAELGAPPELLDRAGGARSAGQLLAISGSLPLAQMVALRARETAMAVVAGSAAVDVVVVDRQGAIIGHAR